MDGTKEGLEAASKVREAIQTATKKRQLDQENVGPNGTDGVKAEAADSKQARPTKRPAVQQRVRPPCTHDVQFPEEFDVEAWDKEKKHVPEVHGVTKTCCVRDTCLEAGFASEAVLLGSFHPAGTLQNPRLRTEGLAKQYPFVLDPFQETAIACLVGGVCHSQPADPLPCLTNVQDSQLSSSLGAACQVALSENSASCFKVM
jgi:superfamily II RNA helicase